MLGCDIASCLIDGALLLVRGVTQLLRVSFTIRNLHCVTEILILWVTYLLGGCLAFILDDSRALLLVFRLTNLIQGCIMISTQ